MVKKALLIGINYFGQKGELSGCINDIKNMRKYLINRGYNKNDIVMLRDDGKENGKQPTGDNIVEEIRKLASYGVEGNELVLHYSGHGTDIKDTNGDELDGCDECICPVDYAKTGLITDDQLYELLVKNLKKGCKLVCLFDCCNSGTILDLEYKLDVESFKCEKQNKNSTEAEVVMISGCKDDQTSADASIEGNSTGAMTYAFLSAVKYIEALKQKPTYKKVMKHMRGFLAMNKYTQIPQITSSYILSIDTQTI